MALPSWFDTSRRVFKHANTHATTSTWDPIAPASIGAAADDHTHEGGEHPSLATHDALGLATDAELSTHTGVAGAHHVAFVQADHDALPNAHHSNANDHAASHTHASHSSIGAGDHHVAFVQADHDALANPHHSNASDHASTNDPTADQKAALAGTSGAPSVTNKYVTNDDARNTNARTPSSTLTHGDAAH